MKNQINIEMIYEDNIMDENCNDLNMKIVRRRDNNRIFKLCYDLGDSLCEVYELIEGIEISTNEDQVYGEVV
jgi:putative sterol carrier protein